MRQFGLFQTVPPPPPVDWSTMEKLHAYNHITYRRRDWGDLFNEAVNKWANLHECQVQETRPWTEENMSDYLLWYRAQGGADICLPALAYEGTPSDTQYLHQTPAHRAHLQQTMKDVFDAMAMVLKKGWRRAGKMMLRSCSTRFDIANEPHRLRHLLESKDLPPNIEDIEETESSNSPPRGDPALFSMVHFIS
ncbi:hypothetical protein LUZ63_013400 [Rhynchospora breviuscula]|uniref:Aminotransferase-like plant mobile domain-containing protein n=1 Tax=Rhynchospora breviuscula TaxID=2022672 RepID=A0A9Q0C8I3_9POAL|nr:hypothetical protein LUZ63_013400 [Rhynchospora breviuscula]